MDGGASLMIYGREGVAAIVTALTYGWLKFLTDAASGEQDLLGVTDWDGFSLSCQGRVHGSGKSMAQAPHTVVDYEAEEGWEPRVVL